MSSYLSPTRSSATTNSERQRKSGFFGAVKNIFTTKDKKRGTNSRRLSILSLGSDKEDLEEMRAMQKRRENCLAIRTAKTEPIEVQRLLIDCEFCNPQSPFGREVDITTPQFTSKDVVQPQEIMELSKTEPESVWNVGVHEWIEIRDWWNTPTAYAVPPHHSLDGVSTDKYFVIYDKFVRRTRVPKEPINLSDTVKILKAGWVGEGTWPTKVDPDDVWSDEELPEENNASNNAVDGDDNDSHSARVVKFSNEPHPRDPKDAAGQEMKRIERTQSATSDRSNLDLVPTRSAVSSLISVTDSD